MLFFLPVVGFENCLIILLQHGSQMRSSRVKFSCIAYLKQFNSVSQYVRICYNKKLVFFNNNNDRRNSRGTLRQKFNLIDI